MATLRYIHATAGVVDDIALFPDDAAPEDYVLCSDTSVAKGWTFDGTTFAAPAAHVPTAADLLAYADAKQNTLLAQVWTFDVGQSGASKKVTTRLDEKGQNAMTQVAVWAATAGADPNATLPYSNVDFTAATLSPTEAASLTLKQAGGVKMASYAVLNELAAGIMATPPTVTTFAAIDAAAWPAPAAA